MNPYCSPRIRELSRNRAIRRWNPSRRRLHFPSTFPLPEPNLATAVATPTSTPAARVLVSVIIPTLNEAHQIGEALDALWWADEVIVVDGGSDDDTTCIAEAHGATILNLPDATIGAQR